MKSINDIRHTHIQFVLQFMLIPKYNIQVGGKIHFSNEIVYGQKIAVKEMKTKSSDKEICHRVAKFISIPHVTYVL